MCYDKPGPRCSKHAAEALSRSIKNVKADSSEENIADLNEAITEFDSTLAGQQKLKEKIAETHDVSLPLEALGALSGPMTMITNSIVMLP